MFLRKISKFQILGFINCLLGVLPAAILSGLFFSPPPQISISSIIYQYLPNLIFSFSLGLNIYLGYQLIWKHNDSKRFRQYLFLTFLTVFWFLWIFVGYFFASSAIYPLISFVIIIGIFFLIKKLSTKLALLASLTTLLVVGITISFGFEEDYCWRKGDEMAVRQSAMITIPEQEARRVLPNGNYISVSEVGTTEVGTAAYYHFKCHEDFNLDKALKKKYIPH